MKTKILILDDDNEVRFNLKIYLTDEGFQCEDFTNAENALKALSNSSFKAAIVDLRLPGMNGEEFIFEALRKTPDIKFIIHTGSTDYMVPKEMADIGIKQESVFHKPIENMQILVSQIKKLISE
jgi:two-component system, OmpR family, response regulator